MDINKFSVHNKKIGILTFHWAPNAGAVLQAYALKEFLLRTGYDVDIINYTPIYRRWRMRDFVARNMGNLKRKFLDFYYYIKYLDTFNSILELKGHKITSRKDLSIEVEKYDILITGSDQVWNTCLPWYSDIYFLNFLNIKAKKISYAASMGQGLIDVLQKKNIESYLKDFSAISVRENAAQTALKKINQDYQIYLVPDPTLLLQSRDYEALCRNEFINEKEYICSYILDAISETLAQQIYNFAKTSALKWLNLKNPETGLYLYEHGAKDIIATPTKWLHIIKNSNFLICGSFHATVFALIFHKNFIYLEPELSRQQGGNQRVRSLLTSVNLLDHIVYNPKCEDFIRIQHKKIDWEEVDLSIKKMKSDAFSFLSKALNVLS